jgi:hypothetical protein
MWFIRNALMALYPRSGFLPGIAECNLDAFLRQFRREATPTLWLGLVIGALVFHLTPLLTVHRPIPAFLLSPRDRDRHARSISSTPIYLLRQAVMILKLVAGLCWAGHPAVRGRLGLKPYGRDPGTFQT